MGALLSASAVPQHRMCRLPLRRVQMKSVHVVTAWFDYLKHIDSTVRETNILKSYIKLSVYHISCFISVALRRFVEGKICRKCAHCFVQSILYKAFIFNLLCVLI